MDKLVNKAREALNALRKAISPGSPSQSHPQPLRSHLARRPPQTVEPSAVETPSADAAPLAPEGQPPPYAISLVRLEAEAHVPVEDQISEQPEPGAPDAVGEAEVERLTMLRTSFGP